MLNSRSRKFLSYYRPYWRLLVADLVCAFIVSGITLLLPLCARVITQNILAENPPDALNQIYLMGMIMVALVAVHTVCNIFVAYQGHVMGALMESDMRQELFAHYQQLSFGFYDDQRTGQLMTRITHDTFALSELYHHGPEDLAISSVKLIGTFLILISINVPLTLIIFCCLPIITAYALYFNHKMRIALRNSQDRIGDINAQVEDTLAGIRVVKAFTNEAIEQQKFAHENQRLVESRKEGIRSETLLYEGLIGFMQLMTIVVMVFGGAAILNASLDLGDLLTFLLCVGILLEPIRTLLNFTRLYQEGIAGFNRFMEMLEVVPEVQDAPNALELGRVRGEITFNHVSFKYRDHYDYVLKGVSLKIHAGEYVAFVGASGVGKTTLCALIPRFYEVSAGELLVDGHNIKDVTQRSLRQDIGVVQQEVYLFAGTVAENIAYGALGASRDEIIAAAKQANAHDFIMALPKGYDTDIGQRGVKLSGGQKQRLSIARVFLKNPPILILDEATSALDNESERAVQEALDQLAQNRTTLVIAHRLSTIRNAQRVMTLTDDGLQGSGIDERNPRTHPQQA